MLSGGMPDGLLIEELYFSQIREIYDGHICSLYSEQTDEIEEHAIFKFQSVENIYKKMTKIFQIDKLVPNPEHRAGQVITVLAPSRGEAERKRLMKLCQEMQAADVVLVSLASFPLIQTEREIQSEQKNIDFLLHTGEEKFVEWIKQLIEKKEGFDYILPICRCKDLSDLETRDIHEFICRLRKCGYSTILVECSGIYEFTAELFGQSNQVFFLNPEGSSEQEYGKILRAYLREEEKENLWEKVTVWNSKEEDFGEEVVFEEYGN